jgi:salicylate hydroxylase
MGLEDAACLVECINAAKSRENVAHALQIYENVRRPRVEAIAAASKQNFSIFTMPDGPEQQARDQRMREMERKAKEAAQQPVPEVNLKGSDVPEPDPAFELWVLRYDVIKEAREVLQAV